MSLANTPQDPLISVVIATRNRAALLGESLHSVLNQTYPNIEVIVVDDDSSDDTENLVRAIPDARIRYVKREWGGISAARNTGTEHAQGAWIAVHDDDDLMLPDRLERQLKFADVDIDFVFGAFINFDDETGELQMHHGRNYTAGAALMTGFAPGHSTWLVRSELMRALPYDEGLASAVDNNLVFRMLRSGARFVHSGVVCVLRRVHSGRITDTGSGGQKYVAQLNLRYLQEGIPQAKVKALWDAAKYDWGPVDKRSWQARHRMYLPDHLVHRSGTVFLLDESKEGETVVRVRDVGDLTWAALIAHLGRGGLASGVRARLKEPPGIEELVPADEANLSLSTSQLAAAGESLLLRRLAPRPETPFVVLATAPSDSWTMEALDLTADRCQVRGDDQEATTGVIWAASLAEVNHLLDGPLAQSASVRVLRTGRLDEALDALRAQSA